MLTQSPLQFTIPSQRDNKLAYHVGPALKLVSSRLISSMLPSHYPLLSQKPRTHRVYRHATKHTAIIHGKIHITEPRGRLRRWLEILALSTTPWSHRVSVRPYCTLVVSNKRKSREVNVQRTAKQRHANANTSKCKHLKPLQDTVSIVVQTPPSSHLQASK